MFDRFLRPEIIVRQEGRGKRRQKRRASQAWSRFELVFLLGGELRRKGRIDDQRPGETENETRKSTIRPPDKKGGDGRKKVNSLKARGLANDKTQTF